MYVPVHHGNEPVLFKGKGRFFNVPGRRTRLIRGKGTRVFNAPGRRVRIRGKGFITKDQAKEGLSKAAKVGLPLIGKLIQGISKQERKKNHRKRRRRNKRKWKHLKGGNPLFMLGNFGKFTARWLGALETITNKADKAARAYEKRHNL